MSGLCMLFTCVTGSMTGERVASAWFSAITCLFVCGLIVFLRFIFGWVVGFGFVPIDRTGEDLASFFRQESRNQNGSGSQSAGGQPIDCAQCFAANDGRD